MLDRRRFLASSAALIAGAAFAAPARAADKNILMVLFRSETPSEAAFKARLAELGIAATITTIDGGQDRSRLAAALRDVEPRIEAKGFDAIYTYGTSVTSVTRGLVRDRIPIIFTIVFDPVAVGFVKSLEEPGGTLTGVTNGVSIEDQMNAFRDLKPMKDLLVLFNAHESNSNIIEERVRQWASRNGVNAISQRVAPGTTNLQTVLDDVKSGKIKADSIYAGADTYLAGEAKAIHDAVGDTVRLFGGTQTFVIAGWLAAFTPEVTEMGRVAADQMAKLFAGADPAKMPVILPTPKLFVSQRAADKHEIKMPRDAVLQT